MARWVHAFCCSTSRALLTSCRARVGLARDVGLYALRDVVERIGFGKVDGRALLDTPSAHDSRRRAVAHGGVAEKPSLGRAARDDDGAVVLWSAGQVKPPVELSKPAYSMMACSIVVSA